MMKKIFAIVVGVACVMGVNAQTIGNESFSQLKDGLLDIDLGKENRVRFGGYMQGGLFYKDVKNGNSEYGFDVDHAYLNVQGSFLNDKLGFFVQADFVDSYPLLDAWVSYKPFSYLKISAGQKQTFTNGREMMLLDQGLAFGSRSVVAESLSRTGRELGLFAESRIPIGAMGVDLGLAVTSGDGRNSFGSSSTDSDKGGLKYGGSATVYPLGFFTSGNELVFNDFIRESSPKLAIGASYSYNEGASEAVGEGHGAFTMYDANGREAYPDYRKLTANVLFKWNGFSFLGEYVNTTATGLDGLYTLASDLDSKLRPQQIADFLALGNGYTLQAGYLFRSLWAIDINYGCVKPEWEETDSSALHKVQGIKGGVSKYFLNNTFKLQLMGEYKSFKKKEGAPYKEFQARLNLQLLF